MEINLPTSPGRNNTNSANNTNSPLDSSASRRIPISESSSLTDSPSGTSLSPRALGVRFNDKRAYRVPTKQKKQQSVVSHNHIITGHARDWITPKDIPANDFVFFFPISATSLEACQYQKEVVKMEERPILEVIERLVRDRQITCRSFDAYDYHGLIVKEHSYLDEVEERCIFLVVKGMLRHLFFIFFAFRSFFPFVFSIYFYAVILLLIRRCECDLLHAAEAV
jgi:hypothetical protein